jgi:hypothetical protein
MATRRNAGPREEMRAMKTVVAVGMKKFTAREYISRLLS